MTATTVNKQCSTVTIALKFIHPRTHTYNKNISHRTRGKKTQHYLKTARKPTNLYHTHLACFVPVQSWQTCLETAVCYCPRELHACENIWKQIDVDWQFCWHWLKIKKINLYMKNIRITLNGIRLLCNFVNMYTISYRVRVHVYTRTSLLTRSRALAEHRTWHW